MSNVGQVLATAQADQITKANAWELFQHATDQASFNKQLATLNLPDDTKAQLWEMKFGQAVASKPGAFQTKPGGTIRNANEEAATERTNQVAGWDIALEAMPASGSFLPPQVSVGMLKGLYQTGMTGAEYLSKLLTHLGVHDEEVQNLAKGNVSPFSEAVSRATNPGQKAGEFGENILEFVAGDEALKGLSLAEKLNAASKLAKLAETSPKWAKALDIGMTSLRQGTVSGAQTLAKGGTPTQAAENTGIVSAVSAGFGALGAGAGALYRSIAAKSPEAIAAAKEAAEKEGSDLAQRIAGGRLGTAHEVAQNVGEQLADAADKMHADYAQGLAQIGQKAQGVRVPLAGSTLQKTAQDLLSDSSVPAEIQSAMNGVVPDAARLTPLLEEFATNPGKYSWEQMEATRQTIGQTIRKLPVDSPLRPDLIRLRGALDDTMTKAAADSGNPEVAQAMTNLRSAYASKVQAFESNAIKSLAEKNPDTVAGALLNKQSVFSVNTLRSLIGADKMRPVEGSLLQRLVDNASTGPDGFNPKSFTTSFNRLGPDVQKAIWGDALPEVKNFLSAASQLPASSPAFQRLASFLEHRGIYALATGLIGGGIGGEFTGHHLVSTGAILAGTLMLGSGAGISAATRLLQLSKAALPPIAAGVAVEQNAAPEERSAPQPIASGASIGEQLIAKARQAQQQKTNLTTPTLPFHPGAGIAR